VKLSDLAPTVARRRPFVVRAVVRWLLVLGLGVHLLVSPDATLAATPEAVTILRDTYGVPHVFTSGRGALERGAWANGYAQAEDRLFQMDIFRRAATGRLAERLGPTYVLMDEVVRRDGYTAPERARFFRRLPRRTQRTFVAFRDGVNALIGRVTVDRGAMVGIGIADDFRDRVAGGGT